MSVSNPFISPESFHYSSYTVVDKTTHKAITKKQGVAGKLVESVAGQLRDFILLKEHPCIIARSTIRSGACCFGLYPELGSNSATAGLSRDLATFLEKRKNNPDTYASFMAVFEQPLNMSELLFEKLLWKQLQLLQQASAPHYLWDNTTSPDPDDKNFGFSFGGKAFYVVGMHPNSSRKSRQFTHPMLVFNMHEQFEAMRTKGAYEKVKTVIRRNDKRLQGSNNPMLQDFGHASEAKQYSGRAVSENWKCPFHA
ncbi:hypothetical protein D770_00140 [Flammeovirgaceae bacterium 311]|nr:hypothetical protein D770_00140 [Flammeovirgaceae bacterium 311]